MTEISKMVKNKEREFSLILIIIYMKAIFLIIKSMDMVFMNSMAENTQDSLSMENLMEKET
jgi:hypothetical protein